MHTFFFKNFTRKHRRVRGFVLPLTLFLCSAMIVITTSISTILVNQIYFSRVSRASQVAYYAADNALSCAKMIEDSYGGIFPGDTTDPRDVYPDYGVLDTLSSVNTSRTSIGLTTIASPSDIICAGTRVFDATPGGDAHYAVAPYTYHPASGPDETGHETTFDMKMPLGDGSYRCAHVTIRKTLSYRQIISQGYSLCGSASRVERALVNTTAL